MAITADRQVELQGLLMGPGTPYAFEDFNPRSFPDLATGDIGRPQRHGILSGRDLFRARRITGRINIIAAGKQAAISALDDLLGAWQPVQADVELLWRTGTDTYLAYGRPRLADVTNYPRVAAGTLPIDCRFLATDPLIYAYTEQTGETEYPAPTDFYLEEYTELYLDALTFGRVNIENTGNIGAPWSAEITGPWVNPQVQLIDPSLGFPPPLPALTLNLTLADGDVLFLDSKSELIYLNGVLRLDLIPLETAWFTVPPGEWALRFGGDSGTGTAEAWMRSTWL